MSGENLKLQVLFAAIDKLTGPLNRMRAGSKGLAADIASNRAEIRALGQAQKQLAAYKLADAGLAKRTAQLAEARAATAKFKAELESTDAPTKKMRNNLERAQKREEALTRKHGEQSTALTELSAKLKTAGVDVGRMADSETELAAKLTAANSRMEVQQARAAKLARNRARGEKLQELGGKATMAGGAMSATVTLPIVGLLKASYDAAKESNDALKQVQASIAAIGNKAGRSLEQMQAQATALMNTSLFDDDDILRKVTVSLTTFDKVRGPLFDRAQQAAVDLSAKFGKDLQGSAIMVGKALQDPVKGAAALNRVGISFGPTQRKMIKSMVEAGNAAGAQAMIMKALESQTRNAALAARKANPGAAAIQSWNNFKETVGAVVISVLPPLTAALRTVLDGFNALSPGTQRFLVIAAMVVAVVGPILAIFGSLITIIGGVAAGFSISFGLAAGIIGGVVIAIAALAYGVYQLYQHWDGVKAWFANLWASIIGAVRGPIGTMLMMVMPITAIPILLIRHWNQLPAMFSRIWTAVVGLAKNAGSMMMQGLLLALNPVLLADKLLSIAKSGINAFKNFFGIKSPSRVMMAMGGHMTRGLALGLDRGGSGAMKSMGRLAGGIGAVAAAGLSTPALAASGPGHGAVAAQGGGNTYHVTINLPSSVTDAKEQARAIKRELDALLAVDARGAYHDV